MDVYEDNIQYPVSKLAQCLGKSCYLPKNTANFLIDYNNKLGI